MSMYRLPTVAFNSLIFVSVYSMQFLHPTHINLLSFAIVFILSFRRLLRSHMHIDDSGQYIWKQSISMLLVPTYHSSLSAVYRRILLYFLILESTIPDLKENRFSNITFWDFKNTISNFFLFFPKISLITAKVIKVLWYFQLIGALRFLVTTDTITFTKYYLYFTIRSKQYIALPKNWVWEPTNRADIFHPRFHSMYILDESPVACLMAFGSKWHLKSSLFKSTWKACLLQTFLLL